MLVFLRMRSAQPHMVDPCPLFKHGPLFFQPPPAPVYYLGTVHYSGTVHYLRKYGMHICAVQSLAYDAFQGQACSACTVYLGTSIYACSRSVPCVLRSKVYDSMMHILKGRFTLHSFCDATDLRHRKYVARHHKPSQNPFLKS